MTLDPEKTPLPHDEGSDAAWFSPGDWSERQKYLESVAPVVRRLGHDFDNVFTGILGFAELALNQLGAHSPAREFVQEIGQATQAGTHLTNQLRNFSRRHATDPKSSSLEIVVDAEKNALKALSGAPLAFEGTIAKDLPPLAISPEPLSQALRHVLTNAREAAGDKGNVTLSATVATITELQAAGILGHPKAGAYAVITITDSGPGLSAETRQRLFRELFYTTKPRHRGLGLAVVYGILVAHGGGLRLAPNKPTGTEVALYVPIAEVPAKETPAAPGRVLVVDDDPIILQLCSATLQRAGYQVQTAASGPEALASYHQAAPGPFHLVISDILMPRMSGVELARKLRTQNQAIRLLLMSGQVSSELAEADLPGDHVDFLAKPFRPEGLLKAVKTVLERPEPRAPLPVAGIA